MVAAVTRDISPRENIAAGLMNLGIAKKELHLPLSMVWTLINAGVGGALVSWALLAVAVWIHSAIIDGGPAVHSRCVAGMIASALVLTSSVSS
jgi:hypothetical protein